MQTYSSKQPLYSIHLFKTAGLTLQHILHKWFKRGFIHQEYKPSDMSVQTHDLTRRDFFFKQVPVCVHGHFPRSVGMGIEEIYPNFDKPNLGNVKMYKEISKESEICAMCPIKQ